MNFTFFFPSRIVEKKIAICMYSYFALFSDHKVVFKKSFCKLYVLGNHASKCAVGYLNHMILFVSGQTAPQNYVKKH